MTVDINVTLAKLMLVDVQAVKLSKLLTDDVLHPNSIQYMDTDNMLFLDLLYRSLSMQI